MKTKDFEKIVIEKLHLFICDHLQYRDKGEIINEEGLYFLSVEPNIPEMTGLLNVPFTATFFFNQEENVTIPLIFHSGSESKIILQGVNAIYEKNGRRIFIESNQYQLTIFYKNNKPDKCVLYQYNKDMLVKFVVLDDQFMNDILTEVMKSPSTAQRFAVN